MKHFNKLAKAFSNKQFPDTGTWRFADLHSVRNLSKSVLVKYDRDEKLVNELPSLTTGFSLPMVDDTVCAHWDGTSLHASGTCQPCIAGMNPPPDFAEVTAYVSSFELADLIRVSSACDTCKASVVLKCVEIKNGNMVATDGKILLSAPAFDNANNALLSPDMIKALRLCKGFADVVELSRCNKKGYLIARLENRTTGERLLIQCREGTGTYPAWRNAIPQQPETIFNSPLQFLQKCIKAQANKANVDNTLVFSVGESLTHCTSLNGGKVTTAANVENPGGGVTFGINAEYMRRALVGIVGEFVKIRYHGQRKGLLIGDDDNRFVMPVKLPDGWTPNLENYQIWQPSTTINKRKPSAAGRVARLEAQIKALGAVPVA